MCIGCGVCSYICSAHAVTLQDIIDEGIRPFVQKDKCRKCSECVNSCPGYIAYPLPPPSASIQQLKHSWGHVLRLYEGHATDADLRFNGSSGGVANALALYCLENLGMKKIVHTAQDPDKPWANKTVLSNNKNDIMRTSGSRYSPASPCDGLSALDNPLETGRYVFIGKPCDIQGLRNAQALRPDLGEKIGCAIGIFCAGTPSTRGTIELLKKYGITPEILEEFRYRGRGWPGNAAYRLKGEKSLTDIASYQDAWGFVQKYRPFRCYLCPDGTSEYADISCGDPWERKALSSEPGISLVLVRTEMGDKIIKGAIQLGYVHLSPVEPEVLQKSQINLFYKRTEIWGRLAGLAILGIPKPRLKGFSLFSLWVTKATLSIKLKSFLGSIRRALKRKYYYRNMYQ
jgi:coenzyme F420 hydrogenase subunit beta